MRDHPLKTWLDANQTTVADFARSIGVTPAAVYRWLAWNGQPSLSTFVAIRRDTLCPLNIADFLSRA